MVAVSGKACCDKYTKNLVLRVCKNNIAVIKHRGLDMVAAQELKNKHVKAILNFDSTIDKSLGYEAVGYLSRCGIDVYEASDLGLMGKINDGDRISIEDGAVYVNGRYYTLCRIVTSQRIEYLSQTEAAEKREFLKNTIKYMNDELDYFLKCDIASDIDWNIKDREIVIVCRGRDYQDDLNAVKRLLLYKNLLFIGVDGGANAIYDAGLKCDAIIGDMDSVSDRSLSNCSRLFIHSYSDGYAPGLQRIKNLGLNYELLKVKGTSEDAAIFLCSLKGASSIYLIGGHMGIEEFSEKGRPGMGSTALLRMLTGTKIVDLKGISRLVVSRRNMLNAAAVIALILSMMSMLWNMDIFEQIQSAIKAMLE